VARALLPEQAGQTFQTRFGNRRNPMSLHLFSTPVQCTQCGTVVNDPTLDRCPKCGALLKERRAPRRLAGVEERYASTRILLNAIRFLAVIVLLVGGLMFFGTLGEGGFSPTQSTLILLGSIVVTVSLFAAAALFGLAIDIEENTRSSFRLQQLLLEELQEQAGTHPRGDRADRAVPTDVTLTAAVEPTTARADGLGAPVPGIERAG
jgi:hypothetical protein